MAVTVKSTANLTYNIPSETTIQGSNNVISGSFVVKADYMSDGTKQYDITSVNITSTDTGSNKYVNTFTNADPAGTLRSDADTTGANIIVNQDGSFNVMFKNPNTTYTSSGNSVTGDYNELKFSFSDAALASPDPLDDRTLRTIDLTDTLSNAWVRSPETSSLSQSVSTRSESETDNSGDDVLTSDAYNRTVYTFDNTAIGTSTTSISGSFAVDVKFDSLGNKTYDISSVNIASTDTGSNKYVNTFTNADPAGALRTDTDFTGANISVDENGLISVMFKNPNTANTSGASSDRANDYNELKFTFNDPNLVSTNPNDDNTSRTIDLTGNLTEAWIRSPDTSTHVASVSTRSENEDDTVGDDSITAACYCAGTLIETSLGPVAIENLVAGDMVATVDGTQKPIIWIGHSTIDCERQTNKEKAYPIRIAQGAFGNQLPQRDLFVSPDHSVYVDGAMIPAYCLLNGLTITQARTEKTVTYYHVELPQHDAIYAEGLPAESYLETSEANRRFFRAATGGTVENKVVDMNLQYPACPEGTPAWKHIWDTQGYGPLTQSGPVLEAVKARLLTVAETMTEKQELAA